MTDAKKAARQGGSIHISRRNFSITSLRGKAPFDSIADTIAGQQEGARFVRDLCDGISAPDALFMRLREIADDTPRLRGFFRAIQKHIERGAI